MDAFLKQVFGHSLTIDNLIRRHLPEWAGTADFATLEAVPTEHVTDRLGLRYSDTVWRVRSLDRRTNYLLIVEFQARPERAMALRTTIYCCLAAQRFIEQDEELRRGRTSLAVFAVVLHHGERPWTAPKRVRELYGDSAPEAYRLVAPRRAKAPSAAEPDLAAELAGVAAAGTADRMRIRLYALRDATRACGNEDYDRFVARAVRAMLRSMGIAGGELEEAMSMDTVTVAFRRSLDEMKRKERRHGIRQGREQGIVAILTRQTARKFGPKAADELSRLLAVGTDAAHADRVAAAIVDCETTNDFLARVRSTQ